MILRRFAALTLLPCVLLIGCPTQSAIASLTQILGTAAVNIATLEANTSLAAKLQIDTSTAVTIITNWKQGTPAQNAIQAINIVIDDLNLFPAASPYAPLIVLAATTAESILAILSPPGAAPAARARVSAPAVAAAPHTAKEFKQRWNAIAPDSASKLK